MSSWSTWEGCEGAEDEEGSVGTWTAAVVHAHSVPGAEQGRVWQKVTRQERHQSQVELKNQVTNLGKEPAHPLPSPFWPSEYVGNRSGEP